MTKITNGSLDPKETAPGGLPGGDWLGRVNDSLKTLENIVKMATNRAPGPAQGPPGEVIITEEKQSPTLAAPDRQAAISELINKYGDLTIETLLKQYGGVNVRTLYEIIKRF